MTFVSDFHTPRGPPTFPQTVEFAFADASTEQSQFRVK